MAHEPATEGDIPAPPKKPRNRAKLFLKAFRATGNVSKAADMAGIRRDQHYRRLKADPLYRKAFEDAQIQSAGLIEDEMWRRGHEGVLEPLTFQGLPTGEYIRRYDSGLLMMLAKGLMPERYRDKTVTHKGEVTLSHQAKQLKETFTREELQEMQRRMDAAERQP